MSKVKTATREVTILVRYFFKSGPSKGNVVLLVENDKGDRYYVTLARSGNHSCSCPHVPSKKSATCYHITAMRQVENTRAAEAKSMALLDAEVELIAQECERQMARDQATLARQLVEQNAPPVTPNISTLGQLHGSKSFSLLR